MRKEDVIDLFKHGQYKVYCPQVEFDGDITQASSKAQLAKKLLDKAFQYLRRRDVPCLIYQGKFNMLNREPLEEGILDLCRESGVGFISFSPLAQGLLTDRYLNGIPEDSRMSRGKFLRPDSRK